MELSAEYYKEYGSRVGRLILTQRVYKVRKDRLGAARTLQTYWNVFCLVRKKETGCLEIEPLIKSQMHRVPASTPFEKAFYHLTRSCSG